MVGSIDGAGNGTFEGVGVEGFGDGTEFGNIEGTFDGIFDGLTVGKGTGIEVGLSEEAGTATRDGSMVGIFVVGTGVDFLEGSSVGSIGLTVDVGFEGNDGEAVGSQSTSTTVEHSLE